MILNTVVRKAFAFLSARRDAYRMWFKSPPGRDVLRDLAQFCYANRSTWSTDPREHAMAEGRREVWLRIQDHLRLTEDELWALYDGRDTMSGEPEDLP